MNEFLLHGTAIDQLDVETIVAGIATPGRDGIAVRFL